MVEGLGGGCQVPIGALAELEDGQLVLHGLVASLDGMRVVRAHGKGSLSEPRELGRHLAARLAAEGATAILDALNRTVAAAEPGKPVE